MKHRGRKTRPEEELTNGQAKENHHLPRVQAAAAEASDSFSTVERRLSQLRDTRELASQEIFQLEERMRTMLGFNAAQGASIPRPGR